MATMKAVRIHTHGGPQSGRTRGKIVLQVVD